MTKKNAHRESAPIPILSTTALTREGEGVGEKCKTNTAQAPVRPRRRYRGGQPGNTDAKKPVTPLSTLKRKIRDLRRRAKAAMALVPE
jgi:hypothetical protein